MKFCITAQGHSLDSALKNNSHGHCTSFSMIAGPALDAVRNGSIVSDTRIDQNAVRLLKMYGLDAMITGKIGENARALLNGAGIFIRIFNSKGTVKDALEATSSDEQ